SSVNTGEFENAIELNAVQRSNPEMQKRVANAVRAMTELDANPVVSIHDHGAGGHLNCLSELVEDSGGTIYLDKLPKGDPTLSDKELMSNESQERMGLVIDQEKMEYLKNVSERERAPFYEVGESTGDHELIFENERGEKPFDLKLDHLFGASPKTILRDSVINSSQKEINYHIHSFDDYIQQLLQLEAVASKDWLTNKVDRSVTGKVAVQQTVGEVQVPLNNVAVMALDFKNHKGAATSIGHSPIPALLDAGTGSRLSVTEALTNLVFAPLTHGLKGVSLSANWMWPAKNDGENARLYQAVKEISEFVCDLGINIPTGKDSLSMTQKYPDGSKVLSPGTVIVSAIGEVKDIRRVVHPAIDIAANNSKLIYISFSHTGFELGGSSFAQLNQELGYQAPDARPEVVQKAFQAVQTLIEKDAIHAGHDISSGGLITALLEMHFPNNQGGAAIDLDVFDEKDVVRLLFSERPGVILQVNASADAILEDLGMEYKILGHITADRNLTIAAGKWIKTLPINEMRDLWMKSSFLLDQQQNKPGHAEDRYANYKKQPLSYVFPEKFDGQFSSFGIDLNRKDQSGIKAAIIREKGVNGDREMAYSLWMAGFDVKDVHMTDLVSGRENLAEVQMIVFVGGFSNSDVLGSAKGWAGSFLFNSKAKKALDDFYNREDTLSLGVCNGCQAMMELERVYPEMQNHPKMQHNTSGKFESSFINVDILPNETVMFGPMAGSRLGIWLAHGEGRFDLPGDEQDYVIPVKYSYSEFPGNPNGSDFATAAVASKDGRHVAIMPHLERSIFPWNWAHYENKIAHEVSPWIEPFVNARNWIKERM
ncbi:MAG: phosphoribosylformylglycinamidine synthase, partial [Cyclobacteriaceae bacterium]|nr:phosphoribosylformylglycinamidine synthase [Cyclobacteriaceae bacterium HetDA_MAG_MS6]